ncbi:MAG: large conductance mechanosensitive channel protein MscL [Chlorobi bacterium]|nr:MAG: large-conductance mechanosensitive channel [Chlorobi bacterium OLB7]MBK8909879.1 large conductance mechanosensitive channel protein MscL [Chlorobiota bacterium]MBX7215631.1 large conductance mechanosensitive channel protein MscL [Candidatus Kapabacteria bacterium]
MLKEFKEFAMRGNVVDLAVGVIIGAAFGAIVNSVVNDLLNPLLGLILGKVDFANLFLLLREGEKAAGPYKTLADAQAAGAVTMNYGMFISVVIKFILTTFSIFLMVKWMNKMRKPAPEAPPAGPSAEESLLTEIRDLLKSRN